MEIPSLGHTCILRKFFRHNQPSRTSKRVRNSICRICRRPSITGLGNIRQQHWERGGRMWCHGGPLLRKWNKDVSRTHRIHGTGIFIYHTWILWAMLWLCMVSYSQNKKRSIKNWVYFVDPGRFSGRKFVVGNTPPPTTPGTFHLPPPWKIMK